MVVEGLIHPPKFTPLTLEPLNLKETRKNEFNNRRVLNITLK
jgi:hypothetical protein